MATEITLASLRKIDPDKTRVSTPSEVVDAGDYKFAGFYLRVFKASGNGSHTLTVKVQHSLQKDEESFVDLVTFTVAGDVSLPYTEFKSSTAFGRYLRYEATASGSPFVWELTGILKNPD